jgi:hypothetical protein
MAAGMCRICPTQSWWTCPRPAGGASCSHRSWTAVVRNKRCPTDKWASGRYRRVVPFPNSTIRSRRPLGHYFSEYSTTGYSAWDPSGRAVASRWSRTRRTPQVVHQSAAASVHCRGGSPTARSRSPIWRASAWGWRAESRWAALSPVFDGEALGPPSGYSLLTAVFARTEPAAALA